MPADLTHGSQSRRTSRKVVNEDEIDLRRARGEISCAECRRLKLKCDKKLPCSSCIRRGCPSICPNGSLSTGQGTRFVLADTTQLHTKIAEMGQRIRQLEDALAIFQNGVSNEPHPLLRDDLLAIKFGPEKTRVVEQEILTTHTGVESIDAIGTLTISDRGDGSKYFGPSGGSETLLLAGADDAESPYGDDEDQSSVSIDVARLSSSFPVGVETNLEKAMDLLYSYLPEQPRAWSLCETYLEHAAWIFTPIKREELINEILAPTYRAHKAKKAGEIPPLNSGVSPHKLGVLYLVFAMGALVDLTIEPYSKEAETYYHMGRACMASRSIFDSPELSTVQGILLISSYHQMAGKRYTMDSSWALTSLGAKLAQSLGLHRESARWNMDSKTIQRRRSLFWELTVLDWFYSLMLGRPPSIRLSYIDCELPDDEEARLDEQGNLLIGFYRWKYEFCRDILSSVLEQTLTSKAPQYNTILDLDRKVREMRLPPHLNVFMSPEEERYTPSTYMRGCILGQIRSVTLLYIHRSWFAQAMLDHPVNPLRSPYAPSFLAAYRCASGVIKATLNHFDRFPELCCRWWGIWTHLFSAAIIVGSIVTRSPSASMAPSAFIELGLACDLFEKGATHSRRARSGSAILHKLRQKAFQVYSQFRSGNPIPNPHILNKPDYGDDELALFGGQTRILVSKLLSKRAASNSPTTSTKSSPTPEPDTLRKPRESPDISVPEVHPSLVEYLSAFHPSSTPPPHQQHQPQYRPQTLQQQDSEHLAYSTQLVGGQESTPNAFPSSWNQWQPPQTAPSTSQGGTMDAISSPNQFTTPPFYSYAPTQSIAESAQTSMVNILGSDTKTHSPESDPLVDLGMMMSGESGMDEQWISFMRDSGLMDPNAYTPRTQMRDRWVKRPPSNLT